jgi:hypothetical protein
LKVKREKNITKDIIALLPSRSGSKGEHCKASRKISILEAFLLDHKSQFPLFSQFPLLEDMNRETPPTKVIVQ